MVSLLLTILMFVLISSPSHISSTGSKLYSILNLLLMYCIFIIFGIVAFIFITCNSFKCVFIWILQFFISFMSNVFSLFFKQNYISEQNTRPRNAQ